MLYRYLKLGKFDHIKQMVILSMIPLCGFNCVTIYHVEIKDLIVRKLMLIDAHSGISISLSRGHGLMLKSENSKTKACESEWFPVLSTEWNVVISTAVCAALLDHRLCYKLDNSISFRHF